MNESTLQILIQGGAIGVLVLIVVVGFYLSRSLLTTLRSGFHDVGRKLDENTRAVTDANLANVKGLGAVTDRISRMEGKISGSLGRSSGPLLPPGKKE